MTASQLQGLLNALAKAGRSHSAIKKARTHLKAMFELAVDDKILDVSPARRITMPKRIRKVDDTYADRTVVHKLFDAAGSRDRILLRLFVSCGLRPQEAFAPPEGWLFPASRGGGPIRPNNYVKRDLENWPKQLASARSTSGGYAARAQPICGMRLPPRGNSAIRVW